MEETARRHSLGASPLRGYDERASRAPLTAGSLRAFSTHRRGDTKLTAQRR
ncbi:MAG: hypothetical protein HYW48_00050 [Deltaproteobacteria bacterium]|nr:hypothetical protein [Deltaproteobacteria bacterium]